MGEYKRQVGQVLRLNACLSDGNDALFVRAFLKNFDGTPIGTINLTNIGEGLYVNNSEIMPNNAQVKAKYVVYKDAGYSIEEPSYTRAIDTFDLDDFDPLAFVPKPYRIIGRVVSSVTVIKGTISTAQKITATAKLNKITGVIKSSNTVKASIKNNQIIKGIVYDN